MGLIGDLLTLLFGGGRNVLVETLGAVRENAEPGAERDAKSRSEALSQFSPNLPSRAEAFLTA